MKENIKKPKGEEETPKEKTSEEETPPETKPKEESEEKPKVAQAIAYSTARKEGKKVPRKKGKKR